MNENKRVPVNNKASHWSLGAFTGGQRRVVVVVDIETTFDRHRCCAQNKQNKTKQSSTSSNKQSFFFFTYFLLAIWAAVARWGLSSGVLDMLKSIPWILSA